MITTTPVETGSTSGPLMRSTRQTKSDSQNAPSQPTEPSNGGNSEAKSPGKTSLENLNIRFTSWKFGTVVIVSFFMTFLAIMLLRGLLKNPSRGFSLFANMFLAGTIIFGGGPVVIPLLRE